MRMSCNGCRVLRKGCSENCSIRPCLQWIKNPDSQANATVFLAKFYGRAGLMNLINAGPEHLRAAIFRSLLYEACGRIVNPIYGSVGLLWSGNWQLCQAAVDSVLKGAPIVPLSSEIAISKPASPFKAYDIRHVTRETRAAAAAAELYKVSKCRKRFKHAAATTPVPKTRSVAMPTTPPSSPESSSRHRCYPAPEVEFQPARSHDSSGFHPENESMYSPEVSHVSQGESKHFDQAEVALELTLGHDLPGRHIGYSSSDAQLCDTTFPAYPAADDRGVGLQL